jgi:hypothetical protein
MTEQPKPKPEEEKSKYYFKIIPKEEFPKFMERLKIALDKKDNKKGDKKSIEFEVRGSKEELNGLALEIFTFDKTRYAEFLDTTQDYIKNALYCVSLNLNVKEEPDVTKLETSYLMLNQMFSAIPAVKDKYELKFRHKGKQVSFDVIAKDGKLIQALMGLGINLSEYHKFNFALKSGINLAEILNPAADQTANLVKICSLLFSIKSETENVRYLSGALAEALKDVKLNDDKIQAKFNKVVGYLNFINSFIGAKLKLEYDAKVLAGEGAKEAEKKAGGSEDLKTKISGAQMMAMGMGQQMVAPMIASTGMTDTVKALDLDSISISIGVPQYENGYAISIKIPGLSQVLGGMLDAPAQPPK